MKLAVAILLISVAFHHAYGFSFPSFDSNEAYEQIREAGEKMIEKAKGKAVEIQETVQKKKEEVLKELPTERVKEMWRQVKEKAGEKQEEWEERKKQMKEMWKDLKQKAGESKEELKKMWKENKGSWRKQAEEKWQKYKSMTTEQLEQIKQEIDDLQEKLGAKIPEKPWKAMKDMRSKVKDMIIALKEAFQVKLGELKKEMNLEGTGEEEEEGEEQVAEEETEEKPIYTEEPFTDDLKPTSEETLDTTEMPSTEVLPTDYTEEVVNDEEKAPEESSEEEEAEPEENTSPINMFSSMMSERRNRKFKQWMKRAHAVKTSWKNWFERNRAQNSEREP